MFTFVKTKPTAPKPAAASVFRNAGEPSTSTASIPEKERRGRGREDDREERVQPAPQGVDSQVKMEQGVVVTAGEQTIVQLFSLQADQEGGRVLLTKFVRERCLGKGNEDLRAGEPVMVSLSDGQSDGCIVATEVKRLVSSASPAKVRVPEAQDRREELLPKDCRYEGQVATSTADQTVVLVTAAGKMTARHVWLSPATCKANLGVGPDGLRTGDMVAVWVGDEETKKEGMLKGSKIEWIQEDARAPVREGFGLVTMSNHERSIVLVTRGEFVDTKVYLSETTRNLGLGNGHIYLKKNETVKVWMSVLRNQGGIVEGLLVNRCQEPEYLSQATQRPQRGEWLPGTVICTGASFSIVKLDESHPLQELKIAGRTCVIQGKVRAGVCVCVPARTLSRACADQVAIGGLT